MAAAQRGDAAAYRRLLNALGPWLRAMLAARCPGPDADDLAQEVLLAVHLHMARYDPQQPLLPWVASIARHKRLDHQRRAQRGPEFERVPDGSRGPAATSLPLREEDREFVEQLIASLPAPQAQAVRAVKLDGLSVPQAAARLARTAAWVKVNVHRGIRAMAVRAAGDGAGPPAPAAGPGPRH
jgi:RNA polymerase sigma-70 factor (ECF subfamily)